MQTCNSLEEVRTKIDLIDDKLVELISERSHYIKQAAKFKKSVDDIKTDERIDYVKQRVRHKAIQLDVSPNLISELFTIMINEMVETEISEFRNKDTF
jgi:isochorismate pyruvate lyase